MGGLWLASPARLLLENMTPSRARSGVPRTLSRREMESYLDKLHARDEQALNKIRDEARGIAPELGLQAEHAALDRMIGGILGSRTDQAPLAPSAIARRAGLPYDSTRLELFESLRAALSSVPPTIRPAPPLEPQGSDNIAFFDS